MRNEIKIFVAGHRGMVGSAIIKCLQSHGYANLITRTRAELDLTRQKDVETFFSRERPDYVFLAAARVGGILANNTYRAEFIYTNLMIQSNVIQAAWNSGVKDLLFLGSSCIYPRSCPQPMTEEYLLSGPLEITNRPYAVAKIAGIEMCDAYNRQFGTRYLALMPTNLYGLNDNFDLNSSHVLPAMMRKFHLAKLAQKNDLEGIIKDERRFGSIPEGLLKTLGLYRNGIDVCADSDGAIEPAVVLWGSGLPRREFLYVDDLAQAAVFILQQYFGKQLTTQSHCYFNVGVGKDIAILELAELVNTVVGFRGKIVWDKTKPDGTMQKLLDVSAINRAGWHSVTKLRDGIEKTYRWYCKQLDL